MKLSRRSVSTALLSMALLTGTLAGCSTPTDNANSDVNAGASSGKFAVDANTLVFGVVPDSVDTETNYTPLMDYISKQTGKKVQYHESTDYAALIEAANAGKIDVASFSGFTYVTAKNHGAKLTPISSIVTKAGEEPGYFSQAIAPKGSSIKSYADMKGKKICFVDPSSTSGYLFPSYNLLKAGVDPAKDITPVFAGKHDVSVQKTAEGVECEAGFAEDSEVVKSDKVQVIGETKVPGAPVVMSAELPADLQTKLTETLKEVTIDAIIAAGIKNADSEAFRSVFHETKPVTDGYYDTIRDICKTTNAKQCQ
ncbi:phosphonate transport system substrate-binding protein [Arthrobacter alpinus]|uniref:Phosphonate transport system substrate-binding protein n=1 Tax=Arthrobacter alpinus TaxID=656366 RepID=A0A1H5ISK1_9MICC|nr:phosphate/phosphite/phosphonate ABC transporter substrate-binding protein [Arthrobacter alpinus]SEE42438.1 phosphonate transport system substrate-binding protein [Arthrobacter alpinus]